MSTVRFQLLGPVSMFTRQTEVNTGSPKQRLLLAALLVETGHPVRTTQLMERLWGANSPATARSALYTYVAQLRSMLAAHDVRLLRQCNGYRLDADPCGVDLHQFRALVAEAKLGHSEAHVLNLLTEALGLYRGTPLDGLHSPWSDAVRVAVAAERRWALIRRNEILLHSGRHAELVSELMGAAAAAPLDESLAEQLMFALHRSGQRAAALRHYHGIRRALADELGVDPGVPLQCAYQQLLCDERAEDWHRLTVAHR